MNEKIVKTLVETGALKLNFETPFIWASGIESPLYCDHRLIISHPTERDYITKQLAVVLKDDFEKVDAIAGTATAGIPWASFLAYKTQKPMLYVRSKPKSHGTQSFIEGDAKEVKSVVLIEDLISTGGSSEQAATKLEEAGIKVQKIQSIFSYALDITQTKLSNFEFASLANFHTLYEYLVSNKIYSGENLQKLQDFHQRLNNA